MPARQTLHRPCSRGRWQACGSRLRETLQQWVCGGTQEDAGYPAGTRFGVRVARQPGDEASIRVVPLRPYLPTLVGFDTACFPNQGESVGIRSARGYHDTHGFWLESHQGFVILIDLGRSVASRYERAVGRRPTEPRAAVETKVSRDVAVAFDRTAPDLQQLRDGGKGRG